MCVCAKSARAELYSAEFCLIIKQKNLKMKTQTFQFNWLKATFFIFVFSTPMFSNVALPGIVLAGIEVKMTGVDSTMIADLTIHELRKLNIYDVVNPRDAEDIAKQNDISVKTCMSKMCMYKLGQITSTQKVISGSVEHFSDKIYITFRILDVATSSIDNSFSMEYLAIPERLAVMIEITLKKMHSLPYDEDNFRKVTTSQTLENQVNNPKVNKLNLSGPRFGFGMVLGQDADDYKRPENQGGWGIYPIFSHIGYQFEVSYLNQGNIQGLFEFIPLINGIEQGSFVPSLGIMHGIRSNKSGLEFAVGTNFTTVKRKNGYYNNDGKWLEGKDSDGNSYATLHKTGNVKIEGGLVLALGKSFRSGSMNFPVNMYIVLRKDSPRVGISLGFNTKK